MYNTAEMRFTPAVTPPSIVKKRARKSRPGGGDESEWLQDQMEAAEGIAEARVDYASLLLAR